MKSILLTGNIHLGSVLVEGLAENGEADKLFGDIMPLINNSDLAINNLELPVPAGGIPIVKVGLI